MNNQVLTKGWLTYQSRATGGLAPLVHQVPEGKSGLVFVIESQEFDDHPFNLNMVEHVVDIRHHQFLKALDLKVLFKDRFLGKKWLKGKKIVVMVTEG